MRPERIKDALVTVGIPVPEGDLVDASYRARTGDWYVQTNRGWFWWDDRTREWMLHPTGPK
jgi:hypothetical protein